MEPGAGSAQLQVLTADEWGVFRSTRTVTEELSAELADLPSAQTVFVLDGAWLVVGPTGLFVITEDDGDLAASALRASARAEETRDRLADEFAWVPFVDAIVATDQAEFDPVQPALVIPVDLVRFTITEGRSTIDNDTLARLSLLGIKRLG